MSPRLTRVLKASAIVIAAGVLLIVGAAAVVLGPFLVTRQPIVDGFEFEGIRFLQNGIVSLAVVPAGAGEVVLIDGGTGEIKAIACAHSGVLTNGITALATFAEALP